MVKISVITSLYNCSKYLEKYFEAVHKIINKQECEFLLLHNAPTSYELSIIKKETSEKPWFRHIIIEEREGLYATWNRGVTQSNGVYCAIWNVDDVRSPESLLIQSEALDENLNAMYAHGDFEKVSAYGDTNSILISEPNTEDDSYAKTHRHLGGCFPMWRKDAHKSVGYFDEQFKLVSDLDFQIRLGLKYSFIKVNAILGSYLYASGDRLSNNVKLQQIENNIVYKRYKLYSLIDPFFLINPKEYSIDKIYSFKKSIDIKYYDLNTKKDKMLFIVGIQKLIMIPYYAARYVKKYM